jgi:hypothetical protein
MAHRELVGTSIMDLRRAFKEVWRSLDRLLKVDVDMEGRRIVNSKDGQLGNDLATISQIRELLLAPRTIRELRKALGLGLPAVAEESCRVYHNANQTITTATLTALAFNSERWDPIGMHDVATNNSRIVALEGGIYLFGGSVSFDDHATGSRGLGLRRNGTTYVAFHKQPTVAAANIETRLSIASIVQMVAGDYMELVVIQRSGGNLDVLASTEYSPEFYAMKLTEGLL